MGEHKLKTSDLAASTGLNRSTISALYNETAVRVDIETIDILCKYFECKVGDIFEFLNS